MSDAGDCGGDGGHDCGDGVLSHWEGDDFKLYGGDVGSSGRRRRQNDSPNGARGLIAALIVLAGAAMVHKYPDAIQRFLGIERSDVRTPPALVARGSAEKPLAPVAHVKQQKTVHIETRRPRLFDADFTRRLEDALLSPSQ